MLFGRLIVLWFTVLSVDKRVGWVGESWNITTTRGGQFREVYDEDLFAVRSTARWD